MILYILLIALVIIVLSLLVFMNYRDKKYIGYLQSVIIMRGKLIDSFSESIITMRERIDLSDQYINELKQYIEIQSQYIKTGDIEQNNLDLLIYWIER